MNKLVETQVHREDKNCLIKLEADSVLLKLKLENKPDLIEIENFLEENSIMEADYDKIKAKLEEAEADWFKVAENIDLPAEDDKLEIAVTKDRLQAVMEFIPGRDGKEFDLTELKKY